MKRIDLQYKEHKIKIGDECGDIEPNITEDSIFYIDGEPIGFYIKELKGKIKQYVEIANAELLSDRVPKQSMDRKKPLGKDESGKNIYRVISQYSTILGGVPPKPHMRRNYPSISSVHKVASAKTFIKAMLLACSEAEDLVKEIAPNIYERQKKIIEENIPPQFRFGKMFTSSISNFNIAANYHIDGGNLTDCVNVIIAKKYKAKGGNTTVPDYGATVDSSDNSMLVYPAWRNVHGVTPIHQLAEDGYRNSLVFYPLKAFKNHW